MKTVILFVLIVASAISCHSQCGYRAIGGGASGIASIDTAIIGHIEARCTMCPATSCVGWELPNNFDGHLYFYSPSGGNYSVQVTQGCNLLMLDTCGAFPPSGVAGQSFDVFFSIIGDAQILVCGDAGGTIYINSKSTTSQQEELSVILLDLANCNVPTGGIEPIQVDNTVYLRFDTWQVESRRPIPAGLYFEVDETFVGHDRIVRVFDF